LGAGAGFNQTNGGENVYIGTNMQGIAGENQACYIASIFGQVSSGGTAVFINSAGKLGTATSSRRFKDDIKPMDKASDMILALKPVTFRYKKEIDPKGVQQFGLVAEEVEAVNPDLVVRDKEGKVNTVRYDAVNAMLLNEFLKEHRKVQEQEATIAEQKRDHQLQIDNLVATVAQQQMGMENLAAQLKGQAAQIQKVSMQLQLSKAVPQTVLNNQ
jgi:2,3-bisphosphoglycerate-independent phosphoglycerate mutase